MAAWHTNADLFHQWEEAEARAAKWERTALQEREAHKQEVNDLRAEFRREMAQMRGEMQREIQGLKEELSVVRKENELLREDNARLRSIINNDSNNSSNPPSSDQKPRKRANEYNGRKASGKQRGGQPGHVGKTLRKEDAEALIASGRVKHEVIHIGQESASYIVKYEIDLETRVVVREFRYHQCENEKKTQLGQAHGSNVIYGNGIKGMAAMLYAVGVLSIERIRDYLNAITDQVLDISSGGVYKFIRQFASQVTPVVDRVCESALNKGVIWTDATGISVNGKQHYIRNISTADEVVYVGMDKKNLANLKKTPLAHYAGVMVHDHETAIYHFGTGHAECNVHILRYLTKNSEDTGNPWSEAMKKWLCGMNTDRKRRIAKNRPYTADELSAMEAQYTAILKQGMAENEASRPKWARKDEASLLRRMEKYRDSHLLFLRRFDVPFDNNMSERDLRKVKNRQKMSGGFRDASGRDMFCMILSFVETCKRRHLHLLRSICSVLSGNLSILG